MPEPFLKYSMETVKQWLANCNANEPLEPYDPRYVDLESFKINNQTVDLRSDLGIGAIADSITFSTDTTCQLFSGYTGTGKTTELKRLKKRLEDQSYTVLMADAGKYHDLAHALEIEDLVIMLAAAVGDSCAKLPGEELITENYWDRFKRFMNNKLHLDQATMKHLNSVKASIRNGQAPVWLEVRRFLSTSLDALKKDAHEYIKNCFDLVRGGKGKPIVFIFDSLEKLNGTLDDFDKIMGNTKIIFQQHHDFLRLPGCHMVYTVPPYLGLAGPDLSHFYDRKPQILPAIKVLDRHSEDLMPYGEGVEALKKVLQKRIPIHEIFEGRTDLLNKMVMFSGGHVRMLISMMRELLLVNAKKEFPPSEETVKKVIASFTEDAVKPIRPEGVPLLAEIHKTKSVEGVTQSQLPILAQYMNNFMAPCYRNGDGWYEIHPLIWENIHRRARKLEETPQ